MLLDLRYFLRAIRRSPGYAAAIVLTLALGIGATTSIVSIVDYVLLRHLPFEQSDRLVMMLETDSRGGRRVPSNPTAMDWSADPGARQAYEGISYVRGDGVSVCVGDRCVSRGAAFVKPDFFPLLRPRVAMGRVLRPDDQHASTRVAVISHRLWQSALGSDPAAVGRRVLIDSVPTVIVGVLTTGAVYPPFADVWQPITVFGNQESLRSRGHHVDSRTLGRLRPGVDSARASRLMAGIGARLGAAYPNEQRNWMPSGVSLQRELVGNVRPMLLTFAAAAAAILLLVCANVAGLFLARTMSRRRELAIRVAIGARPGRIMRQLFVESAGYAVIGGTLGLGFAVGGTRLGRRLLVEQLPAVADVPLDLHLLWIGAGATALSVIICGVMPAMAGRRRMPIEALAGVGSAATSSRGAARVSRMLVAAQFAVALVLLVGAGLLVRSFERAANVDVGFDPSELYSMRVTPPAPTDPAKSIAYYERLLDAVREVPGVQGVGFINHSPFSGAAIPTTLLVDGGLSADSSSQLLYRTASADYLAVMRMHMRGGRWFDAADVQAAAPVFVVNETAAHRFWPGTSPIGARVRVARASQSSKDFGTFVSGQVIGVVRDVHGDGQDVAPPSEIYVPYTFEPWGWGMLMVRAPASVLPAMTAAVRAVDPRLVPKPADRPFSPVRDDVESRLQPRLIAIRFVGAFALTGLALACLGLYGVVAYGVAQRTREMAVRKAVGATSGIVLRLVLRDSASMIATGAIVGGLGAVASTRLMQGMLFETSPTDPVVFGLAAAMLAAVALIATLQPARRASRLDPAIALREE